MVSSPISDSTSEPSLDTATPNLDAASCRHLHFLTTKGDPIPYPKEWQPAQVEILASPEQWQAIQLLCQDRSLDVQLKKIAGQARIVAPWPRSGVGHYQLQLQMPDGVEDYRFTLWPDKISSAAFAQLLESLEWQLPAAIAISLQRLGAFAGVQFRPPELSTLSGEWQRLYRAVMGSPSQPGLLSLFPQIAADPHIQLHTHTTWVQRDRVRRPAIAALPQAFHHPHNQDAHGKPRRYPDSRVEPTVDGYENRLLKLLLHQVTHHCRLLLPGLEAKSAQEQTQTLYQQAQHLHDQLQRLWRQYAPFLQSIRLADQLPHTVTMVLLNRPAYRSLLERYLEFHRSVAVDLQEPELEAPLENLPRLYQLWGVLQIAQVLLDLAPSYGYELVEQRLVQRDRHGFHLKLCNQGQAIVTLQHPNGTRIQLIPERHYGSWQEGKANELYSSTGSHRPDAAIEVCDRAGQYRVYLFDPKYKLDSEQTEEAEVIAKPQKSDIDKMHVYRDAIRDRHGNRVVDYAAILYPGASHQYDRAAIAALQANPADITVLHNSLKECFCRFLSG